MTHETVTLLGVHAIQLAQVKARDLKSLGDAELLRLVWTCELGGAYEALRHWSLRTPGKQPVRPFGECLKVARGVLHNHRNADAAHLAAVRAGAELLDEVEGTEPLVPLLDNPAVAPELHQLAALKSAAQVALNVLEFSCPGCNLATEAVDAAVHLLRAALKGGPDA